MKKALGIVVAVVLLAAGGAGLVAGRLQAGEGGWFATPSARFATPTSGFKTDEIDVGDAEARTANPSIDVGELARLRIRVAAEDPEAPVFVGIGPKGKVEAYLNGAGYEEFERARLDPFGAVFRPVQGDAPKDPRAEGFWAASSAGAGERVVEWDESGGAWSLVVLRLDGRPGLSVTASMGLRFGFLVPAGAAGVAAGVLLLVFVLWPRRRAGAPGERTEFVSGGPA
ncbi:hypothetical protein [Actinocorallia longicatena]|uniref:Uncharacterized protein n=1 Tax=Actinocorallia longicatena TaxID=111803 RepID=A0ABP6Q3M8_9ACTN